MKTRIQFLILAVALLPGGPLFAEDATPPAVQVTVGKPVVTITETKTPSGPVTWLGIAAQEASSDVLAQLPAEQTSGLIVRYVSNDSPAQKAGVEVNDVLIRLDDQILVRPEQLKVLVGKRKAGDPVELAIFRHGKEVTVTAKLESKTLPAGEAMKLGVTGPTTKEWNSLSSLPPEVQKTISEAMSGKGSMPMSITGGFTVAGPDGKQISSGTFGDPGAITQLLKTVEAGLFTSGSNSNVNGGSVTKTIKIQTGKQADGTPASGNGITESITVTGPDGKQISSGTNAINIGDILKLLQSHSPKKADETPVESGTSAAGSSPH